MLLTLLRSTKSSFLILIVLLISCVDKTPQFVIDETYKTKHASFQERLSKNRIDYLKLTGLFKFDTKSATLGSDPNVDFPLEIDGVPQTIGFFSYEDDTLNFTTSDNVEIATAEDSLVTKTQLLIDEYGNSQKLTYDQIDWRIITRGGGYYVRVWDHQNPAIQAFKGFGFYEFNSELIFEGQFSYFADAKKERVPSQLGVEEDMSFIGQVKFNYDGQDYSLDVGGSGFTMVGDATTGEETYGGGRYIYLDLPKQDSTVMLDFNYLYNPPCSFSTFTTCLYPPVQNKLPFKILAGEKYH